jgi:hypothetical protein
MATRAFIQLHYGPKSDDYRIYYVSSDGYPSNILHLISYHLQGKIKIEEELEDATDEDWSYDVDWDYWYTINPSKGKIIIDDSSIECEVWTSQLLLDVDHCIKRFEELEKEEYKNLEDQQYTFSND